MVQMSLWSMTSNSPEDSVPSLVAIVLLACAGAEALGLTPLIVTTLAGPGGLSPADAGRCVSAEGLGNLVGLGAVLWIGGRIGRRSVATLALSLIIVANMACFGAHSLATYAVCRLVSGVGEGLAMSAYGMLASTRQPTRNYAINSMCSVVLVALGGTAATAVSCSIGTNAIFLVMGAVGVIALLSSRWLPKQVRGSDVKNLAPLEKGNRLAAGCSLAMLFTYFTAILAFWSYSGQIGIEHGMRPAVVSGFISAAFLVAGIAGGLIVAIGGVFAPARNVIVVCQVITIASIAMVVAFDGAINFLIAISVFVLAWFVIYPFFMGVIAQIDKTGRLAIFAMFSQMAGAAAGPALGGVLARTGKLVWFSGTATAGVLIAMICAIAIESRFFPAVRKASQVRQVDPRVDASRSG
jgi:predicted MFS family arabinose efflux permease